jgi:xylan 1,4-beta-xylosidase
MCRRLGAVLAAALTTSSSVGQPVEVEVRFDKRLEPMQIERMALGQGGLSEQPMWQDRVAEIRALKPGLVRLFIQEYFDLLPENGRYHFDTLDRSVDTILQTGAQPLMCICFKPRALFPKIDHDVVEPNDYAAWQELIFRLVRHYRERGHRIRFWEVANEPDIGESGGCPYRFKPDSYARYYERTVAAILKADPEARVGGPALASVRSPILPALLELCDTNDVPLHFVSWHIYSSSPKAIRDTITYAKGLIAKHPRLKPETMLNEWNMDLGNPPLDPRFQPCFISEVIWQMKDAGLDYSCYYHIRDWHVDFDRFAKFMSRDGVTFMTRWWNRMPQFDGLFDYQNNPRPSYFAFKLLSRLAGERLELISTNVHGFAVHDEQLRMYNVMLWNFSATPVTARITFADLPTDLRVRHLTLDAMTGSNDENARLRPAPPQRIKKGNHQFETVFEPYGVQFWMLE